MKEMKEYEPAKTIVLDKKIRFHPKLCFGQMVFFAEIQSMQEKEKFYYAPKEIAKLFNVTHQTIMNWVRALADLKLIEIKIVSDAKRYKKYIIPKI